MISVKRLTELKSDDLISSTQVSELMNVITHVANNAALKVNSSVTCQIVYSAVAGDLQGEIRLTASKSVFKYPKYAIQFQKLCAKKMMLTLE